MTRLCCFLLCAALVMTPCQAMNLTSADLQPGKVIPTPHIYPRCGGRNISPQLSWSAPPAGSKSLVLTMIDLDVTPDLWSHWIVVELPPSAAALSRGIAALPDGAHAVASNFGDAAYDGPCPPLGSGVHHYQFTIWALGAALPIAADANAHELLEQLSRRSLDHGSLTATVTSQ